MSQLLLMVIGAVTGIVYLIVTRKKSSSEEITFERKRPGNDRQFYLDDEHREALLKKLRVLDARINRFASVEDRRSWYRYKFTHLFSYEFGAVDWHHLTDLQIEDSIHYGVPMVMRAGQDPF